MHNTNTNRRRSALIGSAVLVVGLAVPGGARAEGVVPDSCKPHPIHVVNPGCVPTATEQVREPGLTLPNLVPDVQDVSILRPFVWDPETQTFFIGSPTLYFDTRAQNLGTVPLQLTVDEVESPESSTVSQCISWTERVCREQTVVGGYAWHGENHNHFHFQEFASYQLRRLGADGRPDYSDTGAVAISDKVSFCMVDSEQVRDDALPVPVYNTCLPTVQGISPGWTDIYDSTMEGQQFSLDGLADGRYALVIAVNYANRLHETSYDDNVVEATLEISGGVSQASIVGRHYP